MAKHRVTVLGSVGKSILVDDTLSPRMTAAETAILALQNARSGSETRHSSLQGLQTGNDHPQYPLSRGRETIRGQWDFTKQIWASYGTEALPGYAFTSSTGTGLWAEGSTGDPYYSSTVLLLHCDGAAASTTFTDLSPAAQVITPAGGGQVTTTNPKFGTGALLGNSAGLIGAPAVSASGPMDLASGGDFTIEFWVRVNSLAALEGFFDIGDFLAGTGLRMYINGGGLTVQASFFHGWADLTGVLAATNTWYHVAIVRQGVNGRLYVNGVLQGIPATTWTGAFSFAGNVRFGTCQTYGPFGGAMDEIRVTKGVCRYTSAFTPPVAAFDVFGGLGFLSASVNGDEKFRIGSSGQLGIGGATYGTLRQSLLSGGPSAPPTWSTLVHTDISDWDEAVQDTVGAFLADSTSIDFTYSDVSNTLTAATINGNPSGLIGMSAVNGTAATPLRSDGRHAIDPAIAPTWTGMHEFDNARTIFKASQYVANTPSMTKAQLDAFVAISTMSEHSFRCIRSGSPNFTAIAHGAALSGDPAPAVAGTILLTLRGDGYGDTTIGNHNPGAEFQAIATETWSPTKRGSKWLLTACPIGSATLTNILEMSVDTDTHLASITGALRLESAKALVSPGNAAGYFANISSLPQTSLDQMFSGVGNFYTERLMRVVRASSAVFDGLAYGAALTASAPAAVANGTTLVQFRGAGFFGTGFTDFAAGSVFETVTTEAWNSTSRGCYVDIQVTANGSATLVEVARFDASTTAGDTRFMLWDVTAGALVRVTRGAADSGGVGFRVLRIPN